MFIAANASRRSNARTSLGKGYAMRTRTCDLIRRMLLDDIDMSLDEVMDRLAENDITPSRIAVSGIRDDFRDTLRFLAREGLLADNTTEVAERRPQYSVQPRSA